ncbi:hypothetical protein SAMN05661044_02581 [Olivibacter domesticus]|uniref:Uncharacterized protein n=1 Tax=Olivibacter domesticus TaxID=407022 RepID=A0A1H7QGB9_OLID1|nr:hypothetical protein SAMN05661044_02581 [Olivibacter domesticus]
MAVPENKQKKVLTNSLCRANNNWSYLERKLTLIKTDMLLQHKVIS